MKGTGGEKISKELKPCPFCGSEPLMVHSELNEYHSVAPKIGCSHCRYIIQAPDLAIDMDKSVKDNCDFEDRQTISYWNIRPAEEALKAEVERLKAEMETLKERLERFRNVLHDVAVMANDDDLEQIFEKCRDVLRDVYLEEKFQKRFSEILHSTDTAEKGGEDE